LRIALGVLGFVLICYDQLIPRYTESNRVGEAQAEARSAKELEKTAYAKLKQVREEAEAARREQAVATGKEIAQLNGQLKATQARLSATLTKTTGELADAKGKLKDVADRVSLELEAANATIAELNRQIASRRESDTALTEPLKQKIAELQAQSDSIYALYIRANEQLKAERDKSIAQKIFGLTPDKGE
jgi:predicted  nucleic acid-binding Zn-ribbon protein